MEFCPTQEYFGLLRIYPVATNHGHGEKLFFFLSEQPIAVTLKLEPYDNVLSKARVISARTIGRR